jgi:hypothetical protein
LTPHPLTVLFLDHDLDDLDADGVTTRLDRALALKNDPTRDATGDGWRFKWPDRGFEILTSNTQGRLNLRVFEETAGRRVRLHLDMPRDDALWSRVGAEGHLPLLEAARSLMDTPRGGTTSSARSRKAPAIATQAVDALEAVLQRALDVLASLNPDFPPTTDIRVMSPCLGVPGRIVDDRSKHVLNQKVERLLLTGCPAAGVLIRDRGCHDIRPLRAEGRIRVATEDAMSRLRTLSEVSGLTQGDLLLKAGRATR